MMFVEYYKALPSIEVPRFLELRRLLSVDLSTIDTPFFQGNTARFNTKET